MASPTKTSLITSFTTVNITLNHSNKTEELSLVSNDATTIVGAIILTLVFLIGVPGNLFTIWSILARSRKRSITTLLILNLACADGFLMALTIFFVVYLAKQSWIFSRFLCKTLFYLCNVNMYASIMLITLMSLHRLVAVVWPHHVSTFNKKRIALRVLAGVWMVVLLLALPALIFRQVEEIPTRNGIRYVCAPQHGIGEYGRMEVFQYMFETVVGFLVPYAVIVSSYVCILRRLRRTKFTRRVRSENLIHAIIVVFGIFWLPYHIINMIQVAAALAGEGTPLAASLEKIWRPSRAVTSSLAFISSCANPILYTFAGRSYIKTNGLAFMARLFEGTALDSGARKMRKETLGLKTTDSSTSARDQAVKNGTQTGI
ncbi:leukotriene B4 receptor 2b [Alosa sapidissima]|uniref:leukotriene B4 receptor 2b n=1 Tax=Alosa sapidissima TaxID=34773 RepID=UPI001C07FBD4|nr:leukotriene B4 receptor 2b [Alosa sapidissima]XP_041946872.1 leukotriene B4 receptor 2b [Alosa sapidissima]XP_041946883.1 leukotriene B4 receptor 2b [Alosa sapidissima]